MFQMFPHELPQLRVAGDLPSSLTAPSALGIALGRPRSVAARGFMNVSADFPAHGRRTPPQLQGNRTDAAPGMQQVRDCDPFRLGEKPGGDHRWPLPRNRSVLFTSPDFKTTVWPCRHRVPELRLIPRSGRPQNCPFPVSSADHSEPVQRSSEGRPGTFSVFHLCQLQLLIRSGVATTAGRQAVTMAQFSTVTDTRSL